MSPYVKRIQLRRRSAAALYKAAAQRAHTSCGCSWCDFPGAVWIRQASFHQATEKLVSNTSKFSCMLRGVKERNSSFLQASSSMNVDMSIPNIFISWMGANVWIWLVCEVLWGVIKTSKPLHANSKSILMQYQANKVKGGGTHPGGMTFKLWSYDQSPDLLGWLMNESSQHLCDSLFNWNRYNIPIRELSIRSLKRKISLEFLDILQTIVSCKHWHLTQLYEWMNI